MSNLGANKEEVMMRKQEEVAVVMVPFQAQGHLNQFLQLACLISSSYGLPVYYVGLATYNHKVKLRANALNPSDIANIHFHDLPTPPHFFSTTARLALPVPNANDIPLHFQPHWNACVLLREPIASLLQEISSKSRRVVVVHDTLMSYNVQDVASFPNAESYIFTCISSFDLYCSHISKAAGLPIPLEQELVDRLPSIEGCIEDDMMDLARFVTKYAGIKAGDIRNTSHVIEGSTTFVNLLAQLASAQNQRQWTIAPILPPPTNNMSYYKKNNHCLDWLNKQPPRSVVYLSFGTSASFSVEQLKELAMGLELSKQKFIWVLRETDKEDPFSAKSSSFELPQGFEERVQGLVVREWAPQPEILAHSSTGGFVSHCGWNSCIESITMGVPIAAWPMNSDQPKNAFLVTELLKIGLPVREWEKRDELVTASVIENVIRRLMVSDEGDTIRKRAQELGEAVRRSTEKDGASRIELDSFIAHITR